ncbi:MAG: serine protease, partial [Brevibacterium linens]
LADWVKMHRRGDAKAEETETAAPDESESPKALAPTDIVARKSTPTLGFAVLGAGALIALVLMIVSVVSFARRRR